MEKLDWFHSKTTDGIKILKHPNNQEIINKINEIIEYINRNQNKVNSSKRVEW